MHTRAAVPLVVALATGLCSPFVAAHGAAKAAAEAPAAVKSSWGSAGGVAVDLYTLTNSHGVEARVTTYGATLVSLKAPDRQGRLQNIVLGFDTLEPYLAGVPYYGATVGRYANRIAKAQFTLDGKTFHLASNDGPNSLHGGRLGFDKRVWQADAAASPNTVRFRYISEDGEEGYPGRVTVEASYRLDDHDDLEIEYRASTTAPTPINLANHAYFNLTGNFSVPVLDHVLTLHADRFTPVDATLIPTGELRPVAGTALDFRTPHRIGERIEAQDEQLRLGRGYDHNWVINRRGSELALAAVVTDPASGRSLEVRTTQPGVQFYSGNFMDGKPAGPVSSYPYRTGLCLETQHFPDSPNHPQFPSTILRPGQVFHARTVLSLRVVR